MISYLHTLNYGHSGGNADSVMCDENSLETGEARRANKLKRLKRETGAGTSTACISRRIDT